jgi:hypothetical protein
MNSTGMAMDTSDLSTMPHFHPFSGSPNNHAAKDVCAKFPDNMVDWVLLQIRNAANPDEILQQKAAILLTDGRIVDPIPSFKGAPAPGDTLDGVVFYDLIPDQEYILSVKTTQGNIAMGNTSTTLPNLTHYDFTNAANIANTIVFATKSNDKKALSCECIYIKEVNGTITSDTYQAAHSILSSGIISMPEAIWFKADSSVILNPLFEVQLGAELSVEMEGCSEE